MAGLPHRLAPNILSMSTAQTPATPTTTPAAAATNPATTGPVGPVLDHNDELPLLQFAIGRYDHYFDSVNNKANFWLAFNTFSLGAVVAAYKDLVTPLGSCPAVAWLDVGMVGFIFLNLISTGLILFASLPYLKISAAPRPASYLYFADVAAREMPDWHQHLDAATEKDHRTDHRTQAHELATGLNGKYRLLRWAGGLMLAQVAVLAVLITVFVGKRCPELPVTPAQPQHVVIDAAPTLTLLPPPLTGKSTPGVTGKK